MLSKRILKLKKLKNVSKRKCYIQPEINLVSDHELAIELNNIYDRQSAARAKVRKEMENEF